MGGGGGYQPSMGAGDNRPKRGSVPGRQAAADPFAKFDEPLDRIDNDYDPFTSIKKPESIPS